MNRLLPLIFFVLNISISRANTSVKNFETARLIGTAGTGVASLLLNEALVLNPAPLAFFNMSSISYQHEKTSFDGVDHKSATWAEKRAYEHKSESVILIDTKSIAKGGFSFNKRQFGYDTREQFCSAIAHAVTKKSSIGFRFKFARDDIKSGPINEKTKTYQTSVGFSHIVSEKLTFGVLITDLLKTAPKDRNAFLGAQYVLNSSTTIMGDVGSNYDVKNLSDNLIYRGAAQLSLLYDIYFRTGIFVDRLHDQRGYSLGISWVSPRFSLDGAMKITKSISSNNSLLEKNEKMVESSLGVSYLF